MVIWLGVLLVVVVVAAFIWNYRRQAAAREAASAERMKAFMAQARTDARLNPPAKVASAPATDSATATATRAVQPQSPLVAGFTARVSLLTTEQRALYGLLQGGLPDHEILARVSPMMFIQPSDHLAGFAREAQERRLTDAVVDFLVCDKSMKAVAVVQCGARTGKAAESAAFAAACVVSIGMRWVEIRPDALPSREAVRMTILGA